MTIVSTPPRRTIRIGTAPPGGVRVATEETQISIALADSNDHAISIEPEPPHAVALTPAAPFAMSFQRPQLFTVVASKQGPVGPQGEVGPDGGSTFPRPAGDTISALRVVYELEGEVFVLDSQDDDHIDLLFGVTLTAATQGNTINIQRYGVLEDASWSWTPGPIWLGAAGVLTQIPPTVGYDVLIGSATSANSVILNIQDRIELE